MAKIFGIDLGTTYSCISYVDEYGKPTTVANQDNSPVTPSVVFFEGPEQFSVGQVAKEALGSDPDLVCSTIKRQMGNPDFVFTAHGKDFRPEVVSSLILKKIVTDASEKLGEEVKNVVITCPAYFGLDERAATKTAGEIAGLNVLSIINEPTAAAISYGLKLDTPQTVLVYDLGGGTFDITVIKVQNGEIEVVATGGDHNLGGKDWDEAIRQYAINEYVQRSGASIDDIYDDPVILGDLELKSETIKKQLTQRENASFRVEGEKIEISRQQFEDMTLSLLDSTISKTRQTLDEAAAKGVKSVDKILLVGGSTFMPQVKTRLEAEFPGMPIEFSDPNESVAKGAAIYGINVAAFEPQPKDTDEGPALTDEEVNELKKNRIFEIGGNGQQITIKNVISQSIALELIDSDDRQKKLFNFIFKNTAVPCQEVVSACTVDDNQTEVLLRLFENNHGLVPNSKNTVEYDDAKEIVSGELGPLPSNLPKGAPIEIILMINEEGLLSVDAKDKTGGRTTHLEVQLQTEMTQAEKDAAKQVVKEMTLMS